MKEIITNEYLQYKSGFLDGKWEIIEAFELGQVISLTEKPEKKELKDWYHFGYEDGFQYFADLIDQGKYNLKTAKNEEAVKESFARRVVEFNKDTGNEVPIGKFRM